MGGIGNVATKSAYYSAKAGWSMKRLFLKLKSAAGKIWKIHSAVGKIVAGFAKLTWKFTLGRSTLSLLRLLPMFPPVVVGIHIFFSAFWPKRVLFFHGSQRNRFVKGLQGQWIGVLILLILALLTNTVAIDEVQDCIFFILFL